MPICLCVCFCLFVRHGNIVESTIAANDMVTIVSGARPRKLVHKASVPIEETRLVTN